MIMFSLMGFLQSCLLIVNSFAILNERFLNKIGWGVKSDLDMQSFKGKIITLLHSLRFFFRIPLALMNAIVIVFLLIFG